MSKETIEVKFVLKFEIEKNQIDSFVKDNLLDDIKATIPKDKIDVDVAKAIAYQTLTAMLLRDDLSIDDFKIE